MNSRLLEVMTVFTKLGFIAFGGPAAHIAMMEQEIVSRRKWMESQHFLDLVGATNLIPGPNSTEMTMHCGYERAGIAGLIIAGLSFILPAVLITGLFAWFYFAYGSLPELNSFFAGVRPAVIIIIVFAIWKLAKKALKSWQLGLIGIGAMVATFAGLHEVLAILGAGLIGLIYKGLSFRNSSELSCFVPFVPLAATASVLNEISNTKIFLLFLKLGSVLFGSGYVLIAYMDAELVQRGLLSSAELLDAVAIGQITPGPVLSTATFVGYQIGGVSGAIAATAGIFLPSFLFVLLLNPLIPKLRNSTLATGFLDAVNVGAVAVMVVVVIHLSGEVLTDWKSVFIATFSVLLMFHPRTGPVHVVCAGALAGIMLG